MSIPLSPIVSEFETEEPAASYDRFANRSIGLLPLRSARALS